MPNESNGISEHRAAIIDALNKAIEIFSSHSEETFDDVMSNGIKPIANAVGLDRVVFYSLVGKEEEKRFGQIYRWDKSKGGLMSVADELQVLHDNPVIERISSIITKGDCAKFREGVFSEDERALFSAYGVRSVLYMPIFTLGKLWGAVAFQDHTNDRYFDEDCADLLHSAARIFANGIIREEFRLSAEKAIGSLKRREEMMAALNRAAVKFLSKSEKSFEETMTAGVREIADVFDLDRFSLLRNIINSDGERYGGQIYRWDRKSGGTTAPIKGLESFSPEKYVPNWGKIFASGGIINGPVRLLPDAEVLQSFGLVSICVTPVIVNNIFWGIAFFEDLHNERFFEDDSVELMRSAAFLCANTFIHVEMERNLDSAHEFTRAALDASPISFTVFDENARVIDCNDATLKILGTTKEYYIEHFLDFFPESQNDGIKSGEKIDKFVKRALGGEKLVLEWTSRSASGEFIPFEVTLAHTRYNDKYVAMAYKYDLRGTKKMMESISRQSEQLKDALEKSNVASRAKSEFLSNMSHEMRTPLNAIIGMTEIGRNADDLERKNHALGRIQDASTHLLGIINDVLDMSKIEANRLELSFIEFDFERMLQRVINVVSFRIDEKQQNLSINISKDIPKTLIGDDQRLAQVLANLLGNACKFTPVGGSICFDAHLEKEEDGICTIRISVEDTGIGISAEQQEKIFQIFRQAESSTVRKYGGTGLGLAICKNIVEMMGGRIWVQSEPGKGSTFALTVNMKRGEDEKHKLGERPVNRNDIRVLVVDDSKVILDYFRVVARKLGIYCDTAMTGEEAIALVERDNSYHVYFIDLQMPDMDGLQVSRALKPLVSEDSEVIMMTANEWTTDAEEAKNAGVDKFLSKPLFPPVIEGVIDEYLSAKNREETNESNLDVVYEGRRILLAEDMEINREILLALLEPTLLEVDCAENGLQAVSMFAEAPEKYDMIFMDVQMPEMDGYEATQRIRALEIPSAKNVPIVAMTANVFREDIEKCLESGMNDHIGKPLDFNVVLEKLRTYLT
jgi:two-component system, sensor histidine kinase and response regulator